MYTPSNLTVFEAAYGAVMAAISASDRLPSSIVSAQYNNQAAVAAAFAESFDTAWAASSLAGPPNTYEVFAIKHGVYGSFAARGPQNNVTQTTLATFTPLSNALIAAIASGQSEATSLGITFDPWPGTGSSSTTPLVRLRWIDGDTVTATPTGSTGAPYPSPQAFLTAIGPNASAADANQLYAGYISPATSASYTQNIAFVPFRNQELAAQGNPEFIEITGNATWNNSVVGGGVNPGSFSSVTLRVPISGTFTITDDGSNTSFIFIASPDGIATTMCGTIVATGATALSIVAVYDAGIGDVQSTATGTGLVLELNGNGTTAQCGNVTCQYIDAEGAILTGNTFAFNAGSVSSFQNCRFTGTPAIAAGAGSYVWMDQLSYNSFLTAGGSVSTGTLLVVEGTSSVPGELRLAVAVAAGSTTNIVPGGPNNFEADMTGAAVTFNLNATPVPNEMFQVKNGGVGGTPVKINATGGLKVEEFQNPGVLSANNGQSVFQGPGACVTYQYDGVAWRMISQF